MDRPKLVGCDVTAKLFDFDLRSLLLILSAFIGNAQISGIPLGLIIIAAALTLQIKRPWKININSIPFLLIFTFLLLIAAIRSPGIGIPYFDDYWIWPIQTLLIALLIIVGGPLFWPMGNMLAFIIFCIFIFLVGGIVDGRFYSIFGPNMLYRIFGFMFLFSLVPSDDTQGGARFFLILSGGFGLLATLLTGSVGGLVVVAIGLATVAWRISKKLAIFSGIVAIYYLFTNGLLTGSAATTSNSPVLLGRLAHKLANLHLNDRIFGWRDIVSRPPTLFGYDYVEFSDLWFSGYKYPHNLFVELYGFYGVIGFLIAVLVVVAVFKSVPRLIDGDILSIAFIVLALGSMLSGDLTDNFGVIGLAGGILLRPQFQQIKPETSMG